MGNVSVTRFLLEAGWVRPHGRLGSEAKGVRMKFVESDVVFESTGRREYCFGEEFSPNGPGSVCYGQ